MSLNWNAGTFIEGGNDCKMEESKQRKAFNTSNLIHYGQSSKLERKPFPPRKQRKMRKVRCSKEKNKETIG